MDLMMKVYPGFDETDTYDSLYGTAKLVRWFQSAMPEGFEFRGVVRQQLLVCDKIPFTSHNSAACLIADMGPSRIYWAVRSKGP
jgi:hypothetical protein